MKKRLSILLVAMLVLAMSVAPAFAAEGTTEGNTMLKIGAETTTIDITVPTFVEITFNDDGTNTLPTNFKITNHSKIAGIHVTKVEMTADGENGWTLLPEGTDTTELTKNTQGILFSIGLEGALKVVEPEGSVEAATGSAAFNENDIVIAAEQEVTLAMDVARAAFTTAVDTEDAFNVNITFDFN